MHGKPSSGCCTVSETQVLNIDIDTHENDINTNGLAKENSDTTKLGKQLIYIIYDLDFASLINTFSYILITVITVMIITTVFLFIYSSKFG